MEILNQAMEFICFFVHITFENLHPKQKIYNFTIAKQILPPEALYARPFPLQQKTGKQRIEKNL